MTAILNPTGAAPLSPPPTRRTPEPVAAPVSVGPVGPVLELPGTPESALVPVVRDGRAIGAYVLSGGRVRYRPVTDPDRLLAAATGAFAVEIGRAHV